MGWESWVRLGRRILRWRGVWSGVKLGKGEKSKGDMAMYWNPGKGDWSGVEISPVNRSILVALGLWGSSAIDKRTGL